jgi:RNA polymerase sigma-70 factor (ECF subfamily)
VTVAAASSAGSTVVTAGEAALIERARAMEAAAWDELYSMHYPVIYRYCSYRIFEPEAAEDVASAVFLEAVRGIRRYEVRETPIRAWLYRIAHNLTANEQRRRLRDGQAQAALAEISIGGGGDFAIGVLDRAAIQGALARLSGDQQQVVILRFLEDLSLRATADVMRRPVGAVKALQHRAVSRLRELLEEEVA